MSDTENLIVQGKRLCELVIRDVVKRNGLLSRKVLQRLRAHVISESGPDYVVEEVFPIISRLVELLEKMHPRLYVNVARQLTRAPFGELEEADSAALLLSTVARDLFKTDITWGKIVSLYAVAAGLATDCVRQGHPEYVAGLVEAMCNTVDDHLVAFLNDGPGWMGLVQHIKVVQEPETSSIVTYFSGTLVLVTAIYCAAKTIKGIGLRLYSWLFEYSDGKKR